jgi:hypothetical protein
VITSYTDYLVQIQRLIDGDDVSASEISHATLDQVAKLAQRRIYREARSRYNELAFSALTTTGNLAAVPADFEALSVMYVDGAPLEFVSEEWLREYLEAEHSGPCRYVARSGGSFIFAPALADGTTVQGRYFARLPDLTNANFSANAFIAREPDLFIYAGLLEAVPFFPVASQQAQLFAAKYEAVKNAVNVDTERTAIAGRIRRRPSARMTA